MRKLLPYLVPYIPWFIILVGFVYGQVAVTLSLPDYMADIVNKGILTMDIGYIWRTGLWMLFITLLGGLCTIGVGFSASRIGTGFVRRLRMGLFTTVESFSMQEFNDFSTASLITRSTNDMQQLQQASVLLLRMALVAPFMGIGAIIKAHQLSPGMSWIMVVSIGILVTIIVVLFIIVVPRFQRVQKLVDRLGLLTREMLTGMRVIRAFHKEATEESKFDTANHDLMTLNIFINRAMVILQPSMMLIMSFTSLAVIWIGARYIDSGSLQIGNLLAFMQYAVQAVMSFLMLSFIFILAPRAAVSAGRINAVLASHPTIQDPLKPVEFPESGSGALEFRDVSFGYHSSQEPVLDHVSFVAHPGQVTAIVGGTGSGKTTLVSLIPRLYDVSSGQVMLDGIDIRDVTQAELRTKIGYVSQKATLFSGTVASNIGYGGDISKQEIKHAADVAQATEFIDKLTGKFDSEITQGGTNLSGGQKQRIAIARAVAKQPTIYVFDDSFSALDLKTDAALRQALSVETKGKTMIIVAQRVSTIMQADSIVVLDSGKVVGVGTHASLMKSSKVYREIATSQLSEAELQGIAS